MVSTAVGQKKTNRDTKKIRDRKPENRRYGITNFPRQISPRTVRAGGQAKRKNHSIKETDLKR